MLLDGSSAVRVKSDILGVFFRVLAKVAGLPWADRVLLKIAEI
jgi:hypothetical protein